MTYMKLRLLGIQQRILQGNLAEWLEQSSMYTINDQLDKYHKDRIDYQRLQMNIISQVQRMLRLANDETTVCKEVCDAPRNTGQATPNDYLLFETKLGLLRRREEILRDIDNLRGEIMTVEEALFEWSIRQFEFAIEQYLNLARTGQVNPNVRNQQLLEAQQREPMTPGRDQKKAQVMFLQQELADLEPTIESVSEKIEETGVIARLPNLAANKLVLLQRCRLRERLNADPADDDDLIIRA
jgi:hypothetical protein